ncbi:paraquat-inducible protein A [Swingsia samuiensis]|uniref:Paraquat-inducible membrane protein A n=1 Tax=Swingsia samuiensis TaxID=1293412 RepID=A0A4Y6UJA0_9PROT|nr:paraquat-inducible protein A [Swingsia samuiensis]QDH16708.1 paraquat-inducible membrane protein A [Swingsia samuiensis]
MSDRFHKRLWQQATSFSGAQNVHSSLRVIRGMRECKTCGLFQKVPLVKPGFVVKCERCSSTLIRRRKTSVIGAPAAFCVASAAIYVSLLMNSLMVLNVYGRENTVSLFSGPLELGVQGYGEIEFLVALTTIIMPGIVIALMGTILYGASRPIMPDWTPRLLSWYHRLRGWSMVEVYVLGVLVAYTKLVDLALVILQPGIYLLGALMLTMAAVDSTFDEDMIWRRRPLQHEANDHQGNVLDVECLSASEDRLPPVKNMISCGSCHLVMGFDHSVPQEMDIGDCPRCNQIVRRRKPNSIRNATCFLLAGFFFYIPANILPVMTYTRVGTGMPSTIISGVIELWKANMIPLSLLVLFASITVPVLKILSLATMILSIKIKSRWNLPFLGKLYRMVEVIGRWSLIDVFMISILCAVVHFGFIANITADPGMVCFAFVVILTIFAAEAFDPREIWDVVGLNDTWQSQSIKNEDVKSLEEGKALSSVPSQSQYGA